MSSISMKKTASIRLLPMERDVLTALRAEMTKCEQCKKNMAAKKVSAYGQGGSELGTQLVCNHCYLSLKSKVGEANVEKPKKKAGLKSKMHVASALYRISLDDCAVRRVPCHSLSLSTCESFVLDCGSSLAYVWHGKASSSRHRAIAERFACALGVSRAVILEQASTYREFWRLLGGGRTVRRRPGAVTDSADSEYSGAINGFSLYGVLDGGRLVIVGRGDELKRDLLSSNGTFVLTRSSTLNHHRRNKAKHGLVKKKLGKNVEEPPKDYYVWVGKQSEVKSYDGAPDFAVHMREGKEHGYFWAQFVDGLDNIDSIGTKTKIVKWEVQFDKVMNPRIVDDSDAEAEKIKQPTMTQEEPLKRKLTKKSVITVSRNNAKSSTFAGNLADLRRMEEEETTEESSSESALDVDAIKRGLLSVGGSGRSKTAPLLENKAFLKTVANPEKIEAARRATEDVAENDVTQSASESSSESYGETPRTSSKKDKKNKKDHKKSKKDKKKEKKKEKKDKQKEKEKKTEETPRASVSALRPSITDSSADVEVEQALDSDEDFLTDRHYIFYVHGGDWLNQAFGSGTFRPTTKFNAADVPPPQIVALYPTMVTSTRIVVSTAMGPALYMDTADRRILRFLTDDPEKAAQTILVEKLQCD